MCPIIGQASYTRYTDIKTLKYIFIALLTVALLLYGLPVVLVHVPAVQRHLATKASHLLTAKLGAPVKLGEVDITWPDGLTLRKVAIDDLSGRPLLSADRLSGGIDLGALLLGQVRFTSARLIGFGICAPCTLVPTALAKWPQVSALSPGILILVLVLAVASISRSRREALEHGDAQLAAQSAEHRLVAQRDAARHQARVAAELHDSVGHALTAIIALSEGMQGAGGSPQTDEAIDMMNALAREGLADTRRAVASLQTAPGPSPDDAETTDPLTDRVSEGPQSPSGAAGWDRLDDLLTTVRATGISAALTETGRRPLDAVDSQALGEVVYVVVREALTNVMRHAEGATRVVVSLDHDQASTRITVSDDGRAAQPGHANGFPDSSQAPAAAGHGLANMAAAVGGHGGTLSAGPTTYEGASGWVVRALVPFPEGTPR